MGHTYASILIHAVFSTKGRLPTMSDTFRSRLYEYMGGVARHDGGKALRIGGTANHVHLLLSLRPVVSVSDVLRRLKGASTAWVHDTFPGSGDFSWQDGYAAFSVGQSDSREVSDYIGRQEEHHRKVTFEDEFLAILAENGIEYDPRYVWG